MEATRRIFGGWLLPQGTGMASLSGRIESNGWPLIRSGQEGSHYRIGVWVSLFEQGVAPRRAKPVRADRLNSQVTIPYLHLPLTFFCKFNHIIDFWMALRDLTPQTTNSRPTNEGQKTRHCVLH